MVSSKGDNRERECRVHLQVWLANHHIVRGHLCVQHAISYYLFLIIPIPSNRGWNIFATASTKRAGIEGTISQGVRVIGLRRSHYIGQEKTHLQHVATAAALNLVRTLAWFTGLPRAQTRRSTFARLYDAP